MFTFIFFIGGCGTMDGKTKNTDSKQDETLPNTEVFQDPFTSEFMVSTNEAEAGYYLFKSGTDGFTMLFPINAKLDKTYYFIMDKWKEEIQIFGKHPKNKSQYNIHLNYFDSEMTNDTSAFLELVSINNGYDGEYREYLMNDNTIYYAEDEVELSQGRKGLFFFGFIKDNKGNKGTTYSYSVLCHKEETNCVLDENTEREIAKKIMHSIKFLK